MEQKIIIRRKIRNFLCVFLFLFGMLTIFWMKAAFIEDDLLNKKLVLVVAIVGVLGVGSYFTSDTIMEIMLRPQKRDWYCTLMEQVGILIITLSSWLIFEVFTLQENILMTLFSHNLRYYFSTSLIIFGMTEIIFAITNSLIVTEDIIAFFSFIFSAVNYYVFQLFEKYPVISAFGTYDANGNYYGLDSEKNELQEIKEYQWVQYYHLMEKRNKGRNID